MSFVVELSPTDEADLERLFDFGGTGYVALHEIVSASKVVVLAARHQPEEA